MKVGGRGVGKRERSKRERSKRDVGVGRVRDGGRGNGAEAIAAILWSFVCTFWVYYVSTN
jgi:hypothetical protein